MKRILYILVALTLSGNVAGTIVNLGSGDLPYTANTANDTLRINGTKITTTGSGIEVRARNVNLDFQNDTLEFGTDYGDDYIGVEFTSLADVCTLTTGWIIHGGAGFDGVNGADTAYRTRGIILDGVESTFVYNMNVKVRGVAEGYKGACLGNSGYPITGTIIRGGTYTSEIFGFHSRCNFDAACIAFGRGNGVVYNDYDVVIESTTVTGPHLGVYVKGQAIVRYNTITPDRRNDLWPPGSISSTCRSSIYAGGIYLKQGLEGAAVHDNQIKAGTTYWGCDNGIGYGRCEGSLARPIEIYNNVCSLHHSKEDPDIGSWNNNARGIKGRGGGSPGELNKNVNVYNNIFYIALDDTLATNNYSGNGVGIDFYVQVFGNQDTNVHIYNNAIVIEALSENVTHGRCTRFNAGNLDPGEYASTGNYWKYNSLTIKVPSGATVEPDCFSFYNLNGYDQAGANLLIEEDTVSIINPPSNFHPITCYRSNATGSVLRDIYWGVDGYDTTVYWGTVSNSDVEIQRTMTTRVMGNNGKFVVGASMACTSGAYDVQIDAEEWTGTSDDSGYVWGIATYHWSQSDGSSWDGFNPMHVYVEKSGTDNTDSFYIAWNDYLDTIFIDVAGTWLDGDEPPGPGEEVMYLKGIEIKGIKFAPERLYD